MTKRHLFYFVLVMAVILIATGIPITSGGLNGNSDPPLIAGRNVNMTSGKTWPDPEGDVYLQRQNEPSIAASTLNPLHLLAGSNDYRSVDTWESLGELPGMPEEAKSGDAWLGVFTSYDGGQSWKSRLLPGYITDPAPEYGDSLKIYDAASDPTVRAGIEGFFYYSGIAFDRIRNGSSVIFVARFKDYNDTEGHTALETTEPTESIRYIDTTIIDEGTSGQFADKPWMAVDIPRPGYPDGIIYLAYAIFLGDIDKTVHDKIMLTRSIDGGETWETPIKLSESQQVNQGTTVAISPQNGHVYVAWRRYASGNNPHAILVARSTNYGRTFSKPIEAAIIDFPFDQPTTDPIEGTVQFRTASLPTITLDNNNRAYLSWTEREYEDGPARIVFTSMADDDWPDWPLPTRIHNVSAPDDYNAIGHQFMPSITFAAGKVLIAWYDSRNSMRLQRGGNTEKWITDYYLGDDECPADPQVDHPCHWRETIDVRIAQADPGASHFEPSRQVSRYLWAFATDESGTLLRDDYGYPIPIQVQYNPPNYPLFKGGTVPFIGDYIDIAPAPMFIKDGDSWRFNTGEQLAESTLSADPFVFYVSWADNRDVRPPIAPAEVPPDPVFNPWTWYVPPVPEKCDMGFNTGMRDQNIYVSKITSGIEVGCPVNAKLYTEGKQAFVIEVKNMSSSPDPNIPSKNFDLIILNQPEGGRASFLPSDVGEPTTQLTINVPDDSSVSRHVFVESSIPHITIVQVSESGGSGFVGYVHLYLVEEGGSTAETIALNISDEGFINWSDPPGGIPAANANIINPNMYMPNMYMEGIANPNMYMPNMYMEGIANPNMYMPNMYMPNMYMPNMYIPNMYMGGVHNSNLVSFDVANPNMYMWPMDEAEIVDKFWRVTNTGNSSSSYTLKTIAGDELPTGFFNQLLVYKVHKAPGSDGETCNLLQVEHHELLLNIVDPDVHPDISTYGKIVDPQLDSGYFTNATFSLGPEEEAIVLLRVIDTKTPVPSPGGFGGFIGLGGFGAIVSSFGAQYNNSAPDPEEYAGNVGAVVISHSSTAGNPITAMTLMILPDELNSGKAGVVYPGDTLRVIGGTPPYTWSLYEGSLPSGMGLNEDGEIFGFPVEAGNITFTVQVTDNNEQTDTQKFTILIHPPDPITIEMNPDPAPDGAKYANYSPNVSFTASGGVPPYSWSLSGEPSGLGLSLVSSDISGETMELTGVPQQAGDFSVTVTVRDSFLNGSQQTDREFDLCIIPLDLEISADPSPLADGQLGSPYETATFSVSNAEALPSWDVKGLPPGLDMSPSDGIGYNVTISGTPTYDPNATYPKVYGITVQVTDNFSSKCYVRSPKEETFTITIHPKVPAWAIEGVDGEAIAAATDSAGNVYVTGFTYGDGTGKDYYTVRYNAEDGSPEWSATYNGPGSGDDVPSAIAVDDSGVYVTGTSLGDPTGQGQDIYTVKYDRDSGTMIWDDRYDGPAHFGDGGNDLALDNTGNPHEAGFVHRGMVKKHADYITLKYSSLSGEIIWNEGYDSTRNGNDVATAIAVDKSGNVYVTGKSQESLPTGSTTHDFLTIMYNSSGRLQWTARDDGPGFGDDEPTDIALHEVSPDEVYIYVTGYTTGGTLGADYYTVKYDEEGNDLWPGGRTYNGPGNGDDVVTSIAVDGLTGDVYVTGKSPGTNGFDYATVKYSSDGTQSWDSRHDGGIGNDEAVAIAVDGEDIYVAGFITTAADKDIFLIKYDTSGNIIWVAQYDGPSGKNDVARDMAVNGSGIYVVGYSEKEATRTVFAVVKYDK